MAFPGNTLILTIFVFLVAFETLPSSQAGLVDVVCSHANNTYDQSPPSYDSEQICRSAFGSDSRSSDADLSTLGQIGIGLAKSRINSTVSLLYSLLGGSTDPRIKQIYGSCLVQYNAAIRQLDFCSSGLNEKDSEKMSLGAFSAASAPYSCDGNFSWSPEPAELKQAGVLVQTLCSALSYISNQL